MINNFFLTFIRINCNSVNQRIDNFLFKIIKILPKSKIYSLLRKGNIRVNKKRVIYKYKLQLNDIIRIPLIKIKKKCIYIDKYIIEKFRKYIVYEDKYILAINKPCGWCVHGGTNVNLSIINIFRNMYINNNYIELVHRLDKDTSGLLLLSKNKNILCYLHNIFKYNKIKKKYIGIVHGNWPKNISKIENYICNKKKIYFFLKDKKYSKTFFKIKKKFKKYTLLDIIPVTGRNHQIRIHTSSVNCPIIGDHIYGNKYLNNLFYLKFKTNRLFLHSYYLSFFYPILNKKIKLYANYSKKFNLIK